MEVCLYSGLVQAIQLSYSVEAERRSVVVGIRWSLLKSSLALGAERLCGPRRIELQGSLCSENGTSSWIVLVVREGTAESWSLNLSSNLTGCSCGKNVVVIAAKALSFVDVFAISASNFRWNSSCFKRNLLLESLTFFKHGKFGPQFGDFGSRNCDWWGAAATRFYSTESFESLEALNALDAFDGSDALAKLIESSGFTTESTWTTESPQIQLSSRRFAGEISRIIFLHS